MLHITTLSTGGHAQTGSNQQSQSIQGQSRQRASSPGSGESSAEPDPPRRSSAGSTTRPYSLTTNGICHRKVFSARGAFHFSVFTFLSRAQNQNARAFRLFGYVIRWRDGLCVSVTLHSTPRFSRDWPIRSSSSLYIPATLNRPIIKPPFALLTTSLPQWRHAPSIPLALPFVSNRTAPPQRWRRDGDVFVVESLPFRAGRGRVVPDRFVSLR